MRGNAICVCIMRFKILQVGAIWYIEKSSSDFGLNQVKWKNYCHNDTFFFYSISTYQVLRKVFEHSALGPCV